MPTAIGTDHFGRQVKTLDVPLERRAELLDQVIKVHEDARRFPAGRERDNFLKAELGNPETGDSGRIRREVTAFDELAYLDKIISVDIPLEQETHPDFFPARQRGGFPTTLRGLQKRYAETMKEERR